MITWDVVRHRVAIAGRVTDAETGKPLRGTRVEITAAPRELEEWLAVHSGQYEQRWEAMPVRADRLRAAADGHFHFMDLPAGDYTLTASLPGGGSRYGTATARVSLVPDSLGHATAVDSLGQPVLATADMALPPTTIKGRLTGPPASDGTAQGVAMAEIRIRGSGERAWSDGEGNYSLSGVEAGERTVVISARGYQEPAPQTVDLPAGGEVAQLDLVLQPETA